jgi:hypothetical protein
MNILDRVQEILDAERNDEQLDRFLSEVRESLTTSNRYFLSYQVLIIGSLVTYYLVVFGKSTDVSVYGFAIHNASLFRRVFLVVPAGLLTALACVGYLRRLQREVFDYLMLSRYRILGKTGLHELRLPSDFLLGLFVLGEFEGLLGKLIRAIIGLLCISAFIVVPTAYVISEAVNNINLYGVGDLPCLAASLAAILLASCGILVGVLAAGIKP